ncbi:hypothetical protein NH340_JMT08755 [Sarcoptes scabiei]|nr:hypothetical protein NH340_JMT08755 [Sarcoptes scabiei]
MTKFSESSSRKKNFFWLINLLFQHSFRVRERERRKQDITFFFLNSQSHHSRFCGVCIAIIRVLYNIVEFQSNFVANFFEDLLHQRTERAKKNAKLARNEPKWPLFFLCCGFQSVSIKREREREREH